MLIILSYLLSIMLCEMNPVEKQYFCKTKQMVECIILLSISFAISAWSNMIAIGGHQFNSWINNVRNDWNRPKGWWLVGDRYHIR